MNAIEEDVAISYHTTGSIAQGEGVRESANNHLFIALKSRYTTTCMSCKFLFDVFTRVFLLYTEEYQYRLHIMPFVIHSLTRPLSYPPSTFQSYISPLQSPLPLWTKLRDRLRYVQCNIGDSISFNAFPYHTIQ